MKTVKSRVDRVDTIPKRKGTKPTTICGPLHLQCGDSGDAKYLRKLMTEVLSWPDVEFTPPIVRSPDLISIGLKRGEGAIGSSAATSVREFAKVYLEAATIHLTLPLVTAHWAIVRGWAEPHYLASQGLLPAGTVLLYTPKDESEVDVCRFHFSQAYEHARNSGELEQSWTFSSPTKAPGTAMNQETASSQCA
jgi:hypothetical protein